MRMSEYFKIVIYSNSDIVYSEQIINFLDTEGIIYLIIKLFK